MKRSQSSSSASTYTPRRTLFPANRGNLGFRGGGDAYAGSGRPKNSVAASAGRSMLGRPKLDTATGIPGMPHVLSEHAAFTASAAVSPVRKVSTELTLKSCLSSSSTTSLLCRSMSSTNGVSSSTSANSAGKTVDRNEEFRLVRNVSFSHKRVREYEVTLGDNPSVSSGAPLSLGWRYNPDENISSLNSNDDADSSSSSVSPPEDGTQSSGRRAPPRRSRSALRLSDRERHRRLGGNPDISVQDLQEALRSVADAKLERKESLNELREQMVVRRRQTNALWSEQSLVRGRRMVGV